MEPRVWARASIPLLLLPVIVEEWVDRRQSAEIARFSFAPQKKWGRIAPWLLAPAAFFLGRQLTIYQQSKREFSFSCELGDAVIIIWPDLLGAVCVEAVIPFAASY